MTNGCKIMTKWQNKLEIEKNWSQKYPYLKKSIRAEKKRKKILTMSWQQWPKPTIYSGLSTSVLIEKRLLCTGLFWVLKPEALFYKPYAFALDFGPLKIRQGSTVAIPFTSRQVYEHFHLRNHQNKHLILT